MTTKMTVSSMTTAHEDEDPWATIESTTRDGYLNTRRIVDAGKQGWAFYWGIDAEKQCLLVLQLNESSVARQRRLPSLKGLKIDVTDLEHGIGERVIIRLVDNELRDVFYRFCKDLVKSTHNAKTVDEAVSRFLGRAWIWHRLLKSGSSGLLSDIEQRGLIGELRVIERYLLDSLTARTAIEGWTGPLGTLRDFELGLIAIEAKSFSPAKPEVIISSLGQLDEIGASRVFLSVTEVANASIGEIDAITITKLATRVKRKIVSSDPTISHVFEERLASTGFDWRDDYTNKPWLIGDEAVYEVEGSFPKITSSMIPSAINDVTYSIRLSSCAHFRRNSHSFKEVIRGSFDGN